MWNISRSEPVLETFASMRRARRHAERLQATVRFVLRRGSRMAPLSEAQIAQYRRDGYLLASGLIPEDSLARAESAMWQLMGADPGDPRSWGVLGPRPRVLRDERLMATYTDGLLGAAAQLTGKSVAGFRHPPHALTVNLVPVSRVWQVHEPHLDCIISEQRHRTFKPPYRIAALTFLTRVPHHGGGTIVWPGSHLKVEALAHGEPHRYRYLAAVSAELRRVVLGDPIELTPSSGDVLFHHPLFVHACSNNVSPSPRLAIKYTW